MAMAAQKGTSASLNIGVLAGADTVNRVCGEIASVTDSLARLREDARAVVDEVMEGRLSRAAAERRLAATSGTLTGYTRRLTELTPALGRDPAGAAFRAVAEGRSADAARYLDFAVHVVSNWPASGASVIADAPGVDLKPDPLRARTPAELNEVLREYRAWAGEPSFDEMADRCGGNPVKSTIWNALSKPGTLPKLKIVTAIVTGCGGGEEDRQRFASAWRAVQARHATGQQGSRGSQPRRLRSVTGTSTGERPA